MRIYAGAELEGHRDALIRFASRSTSTVDLTPGLMSDHDKQAFMAHIATRQPFPLDQLLGQANPLQNPDGSFPYMAGYDGPSQV